MKTPTSIAFANMAYMADRMLSEGGTVDEATADVVSLIRSFASLHAYASQATEENIVAGVELHNQELVTLRHRDGLNRQHKRDLFVSIERACQQWRAEKEQGIGNTGG